MLWGKYREWSAEKYCLHVQELNCKLTFQNRVVVKLTSRGIRESGVDHMVICARKKYRTWMSSGFNDTTQFPLPTDSPTDGVVLQGEGELKNSIYSNI